jgi:hypothetical protein
MEQKAVLKCKRCPPINDSIDNPAKIAVSFANVVTTPSDTPDDWVARNGDKSIFSAFRNILPEVIFPRQAVVKYGNVRVEFD